MEQPEVFLSDRRNAPREVKNGKHFSCYITLSISKDTHCIMENTYPAVVKYNWERENLVVKDISIRKSQSVKLLDGRLHLKDSLHILFADRGTEEEKYAYAVMEEVIPFSKREAQGHKKIRSLYLAPGSWSSVGG